MTTTLSIAEFVAEHRAKAKNPKSAIVERWNTRVLPRGLHTLGRSGAQAYLESYGKGIAAPKVIELATCAEAMGAEAMAAGFWEAAFNLATGQSETLEIDGEKDNPSSAPISAGKPKAVNLPELPDDLQPGRVTTMQPIDAAWPQSHYVLNSAYLGQPKRDGHRDVLFATPEVCLHQSRSTSLLGGIHPSFERAATLAAKEVGAFVLDGERYYLSVTGSEHRTAAQAATVNLLEGKGDIQPIAVYACFKALYANEKDLRGKTEIARINAADLIVALIHSYLEVDGPRIEAVPTARTTAEKQALVDRQIAEEREGEIWISSNCDYQGGKGHGGTIVRTKYTQEGEFSVVGLTTSSAPNRPIGAIEVADKKGPCGSVGTGFDAGTAQRILDAHTANPGSVTIKVRFQGRTENGMLWHARLLELL